MTDRASLAGLVLAGGQSRRMGRDKANLRYGDRAIPQWKRAAQLIGTVCDPVCVSVRRGQQLAEHTAADGQLLEDGPDSRGPLSGLLAAFRFRPNTAWLVVACDLPLLDERVITELVARRGGGAADAVAYRSAHDGLPEPLCAIYEPAFRSMLETAFAAGQLCPRKILGDHPDTVCLVDLPHPAALDNANTPGEFDRLAQQLASPAR